MRMNTRQQRDKRRTGLPEGDSRGASFLGVPFSSIGSPVGADLSRSPLTLGPYLE